MWVRDATGTSWVGTRGRTRSVPEVEIGVGVRRGRVGAQGAGAVREACVRRAAVRHGRESGAAAGGGALHARHGRAQSAWTLCVWGGSKLILALAPRVVREAGRGAGGDGGA